MECNNARKRIGEKVDGLLPPEAERELSDHLAACPACAEESRGVSLVGPAIKAFLDASAAEAAPRLDVLWTRVRAGIEEHREARRRPAWIPMWAWLSAALALAVLVLLFYPTGTARSPFNPSSFDVAVEEVESETATVALVDKGEDLPRVIWIIEDGTT